MFQNKIFLLHIIMAIVVISLGIMSNLSGVHLSILILTIASSLRGSINYSLAKNDARRIATGSLLLFNAFWAIIIGYILFVKVNHLSLHVLYQRIADSTVNVYLLVLVIPILISIVAKIISKTGEPLSGGMISGHAVFCISTYLLSANRSILFLFLLVIPIITILKSRCSENKCRLIPALTLMLFSISVAIYLKFNMVLIIAQLLFVPLIWGTKYSEPVHQKKEIYYGIITGAISTVIILFLFHRLTIIF